MDFTARGHFLIRAAGAARAVSTWDWHIATEVRVETVSLVGPRLVATVTRSP